MATNVNAEEIRDGNVVETTSVNSYSAICKQLVAGGCKRINGIKIKNLNATEKEDYVMVSLTLNNPIRGFISEDGGVTYKEGETKVLFTSLYAIVGALKENEDLAWMANALIQHHNALNLVLNGATIDIIQQDVPAGVMYRNPFTTNPNANETSFDHDIIINYVVNITLGKTGEKMADKLADKMFGF